MKSLIVLCSLFVSWQSIAQNLMPSIGLNSLPDDSSSICYFNPYLGEFDTSGYSIGDTVPDFTLYTLNDSSIHLQSMLSQGIPVLLVGGNLTCPVFRNKIATLNDMYNTYAGQLHIVVVYTMEAHPTDISPYSGTIWISNANQQQGILHAQPTTYGERKALADTLLTNWTLWPTLVLDGPCNNWLLNYGPAPNNAYLIDSNGIVYEKQGWFHKLPDDMYCEIDSLLGTNSGFCNNNNNQGTVSFSYKFDSVSYGSAGSVIAVEATLNNNSSSDNAIIDIIRKNVFIPSSWSTAMCTDICLAPHVDSTQVSIPPGGSQDFIFYFYTDPIAADTGYARIGFRNVYVSNNKFFRQFWGINSNNTTVFSVENTKQHIRCYPNPSSGTIYMESAVQIEAQLHIFSTTGQLIGQYDTHEWQNKQLQLQHLLPGMYFLKIITSDKLVQSIPLLIKAY